MKKHYLLFLSFALIILLGVVHFVASAFYLYWTLPWFDNVSHFLGGLSLGLLFLWGWYASGIFGRATPTKREAFATAFIAVLLIGIGWEIFEFVYGIAGPSVGQTYGQDTFCDVISDLVGASLAGCIGRIRSFYE